MKTKLLVAILLMGFGAKNFAAEQAKDTSQPSNNPIECEKYIKETLDVLGKNKYANEVNRIKEIAKTDKCAARDELQALLGFPKL